MSRNPWKAIDQDRARRFGGETEIEQAVEQKLIDLEYAASPDDVEICGICREQAHYRPTVGTYQCRNRHVLSLKGDWR